MIECVCVVKWQYDGCVWLLSESPYDCHGNWTLYMLCVVDGQSEVCLWACAEAPCERGVGSLPVKSRGPVPRSHAQGKASLNPSSYPSPWTSIPLLFLMEFIKHVYSFNVHAWLPLHGYMNWPLWRTRMLLPNAGRKMAYWLFGRYFISCESILICHSIGKTRLSHVENRLYPHIKNH